MEEKKCIYCGDPFEQTGNCHKYCSDYCSKSYRETEEVSVGNQDNGMKLSDIPIIFILNNITQYQKTAIIVKYIITQKAKTWKGFKFQLYEDLAEELNLSFGRVRKIAKELPR